MRRHIAVKTAATVLFVMMALSISAACSSQSKRPPPLENIGPRWDEHVAKAIHDPARAQSVRDLGRRLIELQDALTNDMEELNRQAAELNANYEASREEFARLVVAFDAKRAEALQQYREVLFAMRGQTSADEWKLLTK